MPYIASYPGLLTPAFVAASDKRWGEKAWVRGYVFSYYRSCWSVEDH